MFKTTPAKNSVEYLELLPQPRREEMEGLDALIRKVTKLKPFIISGMLGYGKYWYKSKSGREGDWCLIGLASQKNYISLYICAVDEMEYLAERYKGKLPKANIGKSCIRIKKAQDVDLKVLEEILLEAVRLGGMGRIG